MHVPFKPLFAAAAIAFATLAGPAVAAGNSATLGIRLEPPHLDPTAGAAGAIDWIVYANIFEGLTRIDGNGAVRPALARTWDISQDGKTYTFHLVRNAKFHDGTTFEASDVVFSLNRARGADSVNAQKALFKPIVSVEALDDYTVKVSLSHAVGSFLFNMGWGDAVIVAPESADANKSHPVGTGPFKFAKWTKGDSIEIVKNPDYWGTPAKLDKVTFKIIADPAAALSALLAGDVDGFPIFPAPENLEQIKSDPRFTVVVGSTEGETILAINNAKKPFDDIRVRRALNYAIDRQAIIDGAMFGYGTPIGSHFAPHNPAYEDLTGKYPYNPDMARKLLAEAGYPDGFKATIKLPPPAYARRGGEIIASQLRKVGVELEIIPVEWAQWLKEVFKATDYDLTIVSHTEPMDIGIYARDKYYFNYSNPKFNKVIARLEVTSDPDERTRLLKQAQEILADDAVNVFLFQLAKTGVWKVKLKGLWANMPTQALDVTGVYWEK